MRKHWNPQTATRSAVLFPELNWSHTAIHRSEGWNRGEKYTCIQERKRVKSTPAFRKENGYIAYLHSGEKIHHIGWNIGSGRAGKFQTWRPKKRETHPPTSWTKTVGEHKSHWHVPKISVDKEAQQSEKNTSKKSVARQMLTVWNYSVDIWDPYFKWPPEPHSLHSGRRFFRFRK